MFDLLEKLREEKEKENFKIDENYVQWSENHMQRAKADLLSARIEYLLLTDKILRENPLISEYKQF